MTTPAPDELAALQQALAAEHAVVYGYGAAGAQLRRRLGDAAHEGYDAHRVARDRLTALIERRAAAPVPAAAAYALDPWPRTRPQALDLLGRLEAATAAAYAGLLAATDDPAVRRLAVTALSAAASRRATWRMAAGESPPTSALPGLAAPTTTPPPASPSG